MKRPLCLLAILILAAVFIYLDLFLSDVTGKAPDAVEGRTVSLVGKVEQIEARKSFDGRCLPVIYIIPNSQDKREYNLIQCYMESYDDLPEIGRYAEIRGKVKLFSAPTNPGEFDSRLYYSTLKISYRLTGAKVQKFGGKPDRYRQALYRLRVMLESSLDRVLSPVDAGIMKAMLLGDKAFMDEEIKEMYKSNGIMHILAVSGLHISIIGMGVYELLRLLGLKAEKLLSRIICGCIETSTAKDRFRYPVMTGKSRVFSGVLNLERLSSAVICNFLPALLAIGFMYSYGIMCGMGTSSFRAICMFVLRLLAPLFGRTYDVLSALSLAAVLLLLDQPLYLYNSGFLFSFGAVVGISVVKPYLAFSKKLLGVENEMNFAEEDEDSFLSGILLKCGLQVPANKLPNVKGGISALKEGALVSVSVMLVTLPVYSCFYYTYPLHSLVLNLVVIPVMGILMLAGIGCMLLGITAMLLGCGAVFMVKIPGSLVHVILSFYKWLCSGNMLRSGFTWYMGHADKWQVALYILFVASFVVLTKLMVIWIPGEQDRKDPGRRGMVQRKRRQIASCKDHILHCFDDSLIRADILRFLLLAAAVCVLTFRAAPDLEIDMIDVGQGDGVVVSFSGMHMLIDGGSTSKKNVGKYQIIPFLKYKGIGSFDAVVMTHEDQDHISGILEIMDDMEKGGIRIKQLIVPEVAEVSKGENYHRLENRALELGIPIAYINEGESFNFGKASFTCLNPAPGMVSDGANAYSTVLFMEYKESRRFGDKGAGGRGFTALFTGDVEGAGQDYLKSVIKASPEKYNNLSLLKVAHHGSRYTTDEEFLNLVTPKVALISCGRDNSYGHPHQELLERLDEVGSAVYRTDEGGCITVVPDGENVSVRRFLEDQ